MLPMSLRPNIHGQLPMDVNCQLQPGCPSEIRELTQHFWKQVADSNLISEKFREIAKKTCKLFPKLSG